MSLGDQTKRVHVASPQALKDPEDERDQNSQLLQ